MQAHSRRRRASLGRFGVVLTVTLLVSLAPPPGTAQAAATADAATQCGTHAWCDPALSPDARAAMVLAEMTLDEKATFVGGESLSSNGGLGDTPLADNPAFNRDHTGSSAGIERLGVPTVYYADGPAAVRQGASTSLPSPTALAATFDEGLARAYGAVIGNEAKLKGNDAVFGPTMNMVRTPKNSRLVEAYGEDPYLTARTGVAWIKGLQGQGVMSVMKHFAGYNSEGQPPFGTGSRVTPLNSVIDERTLREIYLSQFEAAVQEADVASVMCSYNQLNGTYACENERLLEDILKEEWRFQGYVLSDYTAAHNPEASLKNGLDFEPYPGVVYNPEVVKLAVRSGRVTQADLDEHVFRILRTYFAYGVFDRPAYVNDDTRVDQAAHFRVAGQVADRSMTLLRNTGVLPLDDSTLRSLALIGPGVDTVYKAGASASGTPYTQVTPRDGIVARAGDSIEVTTDDGSDQERAAALARAAEIAVVLVGKSGTGGLRDEPCLSLQCSDRELDQDELISTVAAANPNTVVVMQTPGPVLTPWREDVAAVVEAWFPGGDAGGAMGRVLFGDVDPGGRLPITFPKAEEDIPTAGDPAAYPGNAGVMTYKEGVLIGYRHYDAKQIEPAYEFGFGLSYTDFAYSGFALSAVDGPDDTVAQATITVTNTGARTGIAVPQLYLGLPSPSPDVVQPPKQLKGARSIDLAPGESREISFPIDRRALSYWDVQSSSWQVADGCQQVLVGESSRRILAEGGIRVGAAACTGPTVALPASQSDAGSAPIPTGREGHDRDQASAVAARSLPATGYADLVPLVAALLLVAAAVTHRQRRRI